MIQLASLVAAFAGFLLLCAAMQRHQTDLFGARLGPAKSKRLRLAGAALIAGAWMIDGIGLGWAVGSVTTLGHLALAAGLSIVTLHWRVARLRKVRVGKSR